MARMAPSAAVLVLAELDEPTQAAINRACNEAGCDPTVEPSSEAAIGKLAARKYDALVVHMGTPGAALASMKARGKLLRVRVPIIALVDEEDDGAFARAYRAGADEVVPLSRSTALIPRLRAIPKMAMPQPALSRGDAVVADPDRNRGEVLERILRDAGFRVEVAVDGFAARLQAGRPSLKVAVIDAALEDPAMLITHARAKGSRCAWVVRARPELLDEIRGKVSGMDRVSVLSAYGPPDDVLFEANRLLETKPQDGRADARHLHGTLVTLRWKRDDSQDIGYTYNVSSVGLFVRTLAPPVGEEVTISVTPPGGDKALTLEGTVAWRREFGNTRREGVPPGFAVRVTGGEVAEWTAACPSAVSVRPPMPPDADKKPDVRVAAAPSETRPTQSSVEEMLLSVLGDGKPATVPPGSSPLSLSGDAVTEEKQEKPALDPEIEAITRVLHDGRPLPSRKPAPEQVAKGPERPVAIRKPAGARSAGTGHSTAIGPVGAKPQVPPPPRSASPTGTPAVKQTAVGVAPPPPRAPAPAKETPSSPKAEAPSSPKAAETPRSPGASPKPGAAALKRTALGVAPPPLPKQAPNAPGAPPLKPLEPPAQALEAPTGKPAEARAGDTDRPTPPRVGDTDRPTPPRIDPELAETQRPPSQDEYLQAAAGMEGPMAGEGARESAADAAQQSFALGRTMLAPVPGAPAIPRDAATLGATPKAEPEKPRTAQAPAVAQRPAELERSTSKSARRGPSLLVWVGFSVMVLGVGAAIGLFLLKHAPAPEARPSSSAIPTTEVVTSMPAAAATPTVTSSAPIQTAAASAAPAIESAAASGAPAAPPVASAPPAAGGAAPPPPGTAAPTSEPSPAEIAALPSGQGLLYVASPLATNVYVYGNLAGTTNQWIQTKCGPRFLRLGTAPGAWQGEGVVNIVKCGGSTRVEMGQ